MRIFVQAALRGEDEKIERRRDRKQHDNGDDNHEDDR